MESHTQPAPMSSPPIVIVTSPPPTPLNPPAVKRRQKKNTPVLSDTLTTRNVFAREINGIVYYIDTDNNVFKHEDVLNHIHNPAIVATAEMNDIGEYTLTFRSP